MNTIRSGTFWRILAPAAIAVLVSTATAQARTNDASAPAATKAMRAAGAFRLTARGSVRRSLRPAATAHVDNANPATYNDPVGDSGTAADVTSVVVSSDTSQQVTFRINVVQLVVPSDGHVVIAIDSDQNPATGYGGVDYMFLGDLSTNSFVVGKWNGTDFAETQESTASASTDASGLTFSINSSELGATSGFDFWVRTIQGDEIVSGHYDDAPDHGTWSYQLSPAAALTLTVGLVNASKARAGKPFVALIEVLRSDGADAALTDDDVTCVATVGAKALKTKRRLGEGPAAGCGWLLPKRSKGKTLRASVTAALDGATVTKTFTARIR